MGVISILEVTSQGDEFGQFTHSGGFNLAKIDVSIMFPVSMFVSSFSFGIRAWLRMSSSFRCFLCFTVLFFA